VNVSPADPQAVHDRDERRPGRKTPPSRLPRNATYSAIAITRWEADLAKPRVYAAYPGVEQLLIALLDRERDRAIAALTDAMPTFDGGAGFDEILVAAATNLLQSVAGNPESWRLLLLSADGAPGEVRDNFTDARESQLRALLTWGRDRRPGLADLDLELTAISLLAIGEQAARQMLSLPEQFTAERFGRFARSLLDMLSPPPR
jgi:AcrR family transcriptional regulator